MSAIVTIALILKRTEKIILFKNHISRRGMKVTLEALSQELQYK
jgi:hypothetical protein